MGPMGPQGTTGPMQSSDQAGKTHQERPDGIHLDGAQTVPQALPQDLPQAQVPGIARLLTVGVGGGGSNAVNRMMEAGVRGVEFIAMNTDAQALDLSHAPVRLRLGETLTRGLGAGGNPEIGRRAAEESYTAIRESLAGADMVFITAGMGGGTGTGASPLVAQAAREQGALTVAIVTTPFAFERRRKMLAEQGIGALREMVDALIVVPNERLMALASQNTSAFDAYRLADDVLRQGIQGISELITIPGLINLDFADIKEVMADAGSALMSVGQANGEQRAEEAARAAITNPLLDVDISGARGVIFNITGGDDLTMLEVNRIADIISGAAHPDANIMFGTVYDPSSAGSLKITVVATGFEPRVAYDRQRPMRAKTSSGLGTPATAASSTPNTPSAPAAARPVHPLGPAVSVTGPHPAVNGTGGAPGANGGHSATPAAASGPYVRTTPSDRHEHFAITPLDRRGTEAGAPAGPHGAHPHDQAPQRETGPQPAVAQPRHEQMRHSALRPGYHGDEFVANDDPDEAEAPTAPRSRWEHLLRRGQ